MMKRSTAVVTAVAAALCAQFAAEGASYFRTQYHRLFLSNLYFDTGEFCGFNESWRFTILLTETDEEGRVRSEWSPHLNQHASFSVAGALPDAIQHTVFERLIMHVSPPEEEDQPPHGFIAGGGQCTSYTISGIVTEASVDAGWDGEFRVDTGRIVVQFGNGPHFIVDDW
ncbi:hypothetical protein GX586_12840, partial [bacterium]|nr:hypothetical protein [bacterium]